MPSVLVTGAARGIGKSIANHLADSGWDVIAGVRNERDAIAITTGNPQRISAVILDVTDAGHIAALPDSLPPRLDAVVNNAGVFIGGPMETVTPAAWRKQLEVNLIGQMAVTQAVLPRLRAAKGRIVFVSSINGQMSMPLAGTYSASKFALEAAADAMRMELRPWGVSVVVVEPGPTDTDITDTLMPDTEGDLTAEQRTLYADHIDGLNKSIPVLKRLAVPADRVAAVVKRALSTRRPRARYVVGLGPKLQIAILMNIPVAVRDRLLRLISRQP